jgi:predicted transposase YdaD
MVCSELPDSEFMLKALVPGIDENMAKTVLEVLNDGIDNDLTRWAEIVIERNLNIIMKVSESMKNSKKVEKVLMEYGYCDKWRQEGKQEGEQEGWQKGKQEGALEVITLLEKGYSLSDAKKMLLEKNYGKVAALV